MILIVALLGILAASLCLLAMISSRRDDQPIRSKEFWF